MSIMRNCAHINTFTLRTGWNVSLVKVWVLVCFLLKHFREIPPSENSFLHHSLHGHFIREQHPAVFTRYICGSFIGKDALQVLVVSAWRTRWSSCGVGECSKEKRLPGIYSVQFPYVWSFRSKILRFRQNSDDFGSSYRMRDITPMMCFEVTSTLWAFFFPSKEFLVHNFQKNASQSP